MMFDGSVKLAQKVSVGDLLMGDDSSPRQVMSTTNGMDDLYEVVPQKGDSYIVNSEHILTLFYDDSHGNKKVLDIPVKEYMKSIKQFRTRAKGIRAEVEFPSRAIPFDAYMIGYWLGDGTSVRPEITTADFEVIKYFQDNLPNGLEIYTPKGMKKITYTIGRHFGSNEKNEFWRAISSLNLKNNKHIPDVYKINSREVRLNMLAGLIDSDGCVSNGCFDITLKQEKLADDVVYIARSLGFAAYKKKAIKGIKSIGFLGTYYRITISGKISEVPVRIPRKKADKRKSVKDVLHTGIRIREVGRGEYYGFTLDGNGRFLLGDFTITHNSWWWLQDALETAIGSIDKDIDPTPVYYWCGEMRREQIMRRFYQILGVNGRAMKSGHMTNDDWDLLNEAKAIVMNSPIYIDDRPLKITELKPILTRQIAEHGIKQVVLDYALLI